MNAKVKSVLLSVLFGAFVIIFPVISGVIAGITKMTTPSVYYLQAGFMAIPIVVFLIIFFVKKKNPNDYYLGDDFEWKNLIYYLLVIPVFIPLMIKGFVRKDVASFFGILLLYLAVGIAEELYFRSVVINTLKKEFKPLVYILISTLIFGLGHLSVAFSGTTALDVVLTIVNALFFGLMAGSLIYLTNTVLPLIVIHFLFDFESKFIAMTGDVLFVCEIIRGSVLALISIVLFVACYIKYKNESKIEILDGPGMCVENKEEKEETE